MTQATRSALMSVATTLAENIDATQDYIPVASTDNFSTSVVAEVETTNEVVSFTDISQNNVQYSQDFGNAYWIKNNSSIVSNTVTAPDGTTTADQLIEDSSTGTGHNFNRPNTNLPILYTNGVGVSCYVKSNTRSSFLLGWGSGAATINTRAIFNLSTGVITSTNPYGLTMVTELLDVGNGWYRAKFHLATLYPMNRGFFLGLVDSSGNYVYDGDGTSGIYIWGAQLELDEPTVSTYLPTTTTEPLYGLTDVTRGVNGTTAASATSGDAIQQLPYALLNVDMPVRLTGLSVSSDGTGAGRLTLCDKVGTHLCDVDIPDTKIFDLTFDGGIIFPNGIYVANSDNITSYTLYTSGYNSPNLTAGG